MTAPYKATGIASRDWPEACTPISRRRMTRTPLMPMITASSRLHMVTGGSGVLNPIR